MKSVSQRFESLFLKALATRTRDSQRPNILLELRIKFDSASQSFHLIQVLLNCTGTGSNDSVSRLSDQGSGTLDLHAIPETLKPDIVIGVRGPLQYS